MSCGYLNAKDWWSNLENSIKESSTQPTLTSPIEVEFLDMPDYEFNSIGVRGLGEIGITGTAAAVANAVFHATGVRVRDLPITVEKLL